MGRLQGGERVWVPVEGLTGLKKLPQRVHKRPVPPIHILGAKGKLDTDQLGHKELAHRVVPRGAHELKYKDEGYLQVQSEHQEAE